MYEVSAACHGYCYWINEHENYSYENGKCAVAAGLYEFLTFKYELSSTVKVGEIC